MWRRGTGCSLNRLSTQFTQAFFQCNHLGSHPRVPAHIVAHPQLQVPQTGQWIQHMVFIVHIEWVGEVLWLTVNVGPQRRGLTVYFLKVRKQKKWVSGNSTSCTAQSVLKLKSSSVCKSRACLFHPLLLAVVEECSKEAAVQVVQDGNKKELIEFKGRGKLEKTRTQLEP